jgi:hypothetical protein
MATAALALPEDALAVLREQIRQVVLEEAHHVLKDVEWRHAQVLERERTLEDRTPWMRRKVTAEDFNTSQHILTGYTITNNSPGAGSVAWASLHIVYNGVDNVITDGNTALKYGYWQIATPTAMQTSNTKPTLGKDDLLIFVNTGGTAVITALDSNQSMPQLVANAAIDSTALATGAVTTTAIANNAVGSTQLANNAVGTTQLANGAVTTTQISATAGITGTQIAGTTVTAANIANNTLTTTQISATAGITGAQLSGTAGITGGQIAGTTVTSTNLANGAVGTTQLASGAVTSTILGSGAVTAVKLSTLQHVLY